MEPARAPDDAEVFDFLDEFHRDRDVGRVQSLAFYLKRYPGHEEGIAREYVRLTRAADEPAPASADGERRIGPYRLVRELGRGGQGMVWLALDTRIARQVALKCLPPSFAMLSNERRRRFQREAELVSRLEHPSICPVYEAQIDGDPPYIAMRWVEGETLAGEIARARAGASPTLPLRPANPVDLRRVLAYFERVARALHAAHEAGVIHRDVKPGNLMVTRDGEPVVLDFGQARDEHAELGERTLSGEVMGTPAYMSPEQVLGSASALDRRTDVWSLGASLFEALTLVRPFDAPNVAALLNAIRERACPDPRRLNPSLGDDVAVVLETALEKDVGRRYATALELAEELRRIREYEPIRARPSGPLLKLRRWSQRHPAIALSSTLVAIGLTAGLAWTSHLLQRERKANSDKDEALRKERAMLDHALGRHLADRASETLDEDPSASLALAIEAFDLAPCHQTRAALLASLEECYLAEQLVAQGPRIVRDLDLAPDSRLALAGFEDGTARVWDLRTGEEALRLADHPGEVSHARFAAEGEIVTASTDGRLRIWRAGDGALVREIEAPEASLADLALDPANRLVAMLGRGGELALAELASGERVSCASLGAGLDRIRFSSDGRTLLVSGTEASCALAIDASGAELLAKLPHAGLTASDLAADGTRALTASADGAIVVWKLPEGRPEGAPLEHGAPVSCAVFTPDGARIASGTDDAERSCVSLWNLATRERRVLAGAHRREIVSVSVSPDGRKIAADSRDPLVTAWAIDGEPLFSAKLFAPPVRTVWTPDAQRLVTRNAAYWIDVWWGENRPDVYALPGDGEPVVGVAFDAVGARALTVSRSGVARLWHTPPGAAERGPLAPGTLLGELDLGAERITRALFGPDGSDLVVTLSDGGHVVQWSARDLEPVAAHAIEGGGAWAALGAVGELGLRLAVVDGKGRVHVLSLGPGAEEWTIPGEAQAAVFVPDTRWLAVARGDDTLHVYDVATRELAGWHSWRSGKGVHGAIGIAVRPKGCEIAVACRDWRVRSFDPLGTRASERTMFEMLDLAYDPTGSYLLVIGANGPGAVRVHELDHNVTVKPAITHAGNLTGGSFDDEGLLVLTTSDDGTALIRDTRTGEALLQLDGRGGPMLCATFSPGAGGDRRVLTGSADGVARIWPLDPAAAARARKPRELREGDEVARERRLALPLVYR